MSVIEYWFVERDYCEEFREKVEGEAKARYESRQEEAEQEIERILRA